MAKAQKTSTHVKTVEKLQQDLKGKSWEEIADILREAIAPIESKVSGLIPAGGESSRGKSFMENTKAVMRRPDYPKEISGGEWYLNHTLPMYSKGGRKLKNITFIQSAALHMEENGINPKRITVIVTNDEQKKYMHQQLTEDFGVGMLDQNIIKIDPKHGFAGAIIQGLYNIAEYNPDGIVCVKTCDAHILPSAEYNAAMALGMLSAKEGYPTVIGIKNNNAEELTALGNIICENNGLWVSDIRRFDEKPPLERIKKNLMDDEVDVRANTAICFVPVKEAIEAIEASDLNLDREISVNQFYDVLMASLGMKVVKGEFKWRDLGSPLEFYEYHKSIGELTPRGNVHYGEGEVDTMNHSCSGLLTNCNKGLTLKIGNIDNAVVSALREPGTQNIRVFVKDFDYSQDGSDAKMLDSGSKRFSVDSENSRYISTPNYPGLVKTAFTGKSDVYVWISQEYDKENISHPKIVVNVVKSLED